MLTGQLPFTASSPAALAKCHLSQRPRDPAELRYGISPDISELVSRLLVKQPLRRPSIDQLIRWLAELEIDQLARA
jgi:serine/threonine protein kinase